ncbi:hypothetical protein G6F65_017567 [Rhizopus arrhizus]|nr:hypothetical protein G6F65_017567 [Rhizopus arrhizus]
MGKQGKLPVIYVRNGPPAFLPLSGLNGEGPRPETGEAPGMPRQTPGSEPFQHDLALCLAAFDERVGAAQVGGVDRAVVLAQRRAQGAVVDQAGRLVQQFVLGDHVGRVVQGAREHEFPMQRRGFAFQQADVDGGRVVDQRDLALRGDCRRHLRKVLDGLVQAGDIADLIETDALELFGQGLAVVDDMVSAQLAHPRLRFGTRGRADHRQAGQLARQLHQDRPHAAGRADDKQAAPRR